MPSIASLGSRVTKLLKTPGLNDAKSSQQTPGSGISPHLLSLVVATSSIVALLVVVGVALWWWTFRGRGRERRRLFRTRGGSDLVSDSDLDSEVKAEGDVRGDVRGNGLSFGSHRKREDLMEGGLGLGPVLDIRANSTETGVGTGSVDLDKDSHDHDLPVIVVSTSGRDLSNTVNDAEIYGYDHVAINSTNARLDVDIIINAGNEHEHEDTSGSSFYSDEVLEEISSIAADLKRFSRARSLDVEVKSIDSVKSFAMIVEVPDHHEEQGLSAESFDVFDNDDPSNRDSVNEAIESLEALLLSLERMANERVYDESQAYSDDSVYSDDSAYLSTISAPVPVPPVPIFAPIAERVSVKRPKPMETIIEEDSVELSIVDRLKPIPRTPTTPGTMSDTTLRDDEAFLPSTSTPKKGTSSDTISALITALSSSPTVDDNTDSDFPKDSPPTIGSTTLTLQPIAQHILPGGTRAYLPFVNSVVTLCGRGQEFEPSRPALVRLPLGEVKSINHLTPAPSRPPRRNLGRGRGHVCLSSRDKSENSQRTKGGVPVLTDSPCKC